MLLILLACWLLWFRRLWKTSSQRYRFRAKTDITKVPQNTLPDTIEFATAKAGQKFRKKPAWVPKKIIRLRVLCPKASLRDIQMQFNRAEAQRSGESVSHQYVSYTLRAHRYQIHVLSKALHNRRPKPLPLHLMWAADLTFLPDQEGKPQPILGIIEHASRVNLILTAVRVKMSVALLRGLANAIECAQALPKILKTDNEAIFTSSLFRLGLWLCNIKHRTTEIASPWQNGKIERFFGIFKQKARGLVFNTQQELNAQLSVFRFYYNHVRPHGYLDYRTPFEAYNKLGIQYVKPGQDEPLFLDAWDKRLTGYWFRHD